MLTLVMWYGFNLFTVGDVESFESQATRHHRCPSVSRQVGMAVHVKVLSKKVSSG